MEVEYTLLVPHGARDKVKKGPLASGSSRLVRVEKISKKEEGFLGTLNFFRK